jgi:hypothetical protein
VSWLPSLFIVLQAPASLPQPVIASSTAAATSDEPLLLQSPSSQEAFPEFFSRRLESIVPPQLLDPDNMTRIHATVRFGPVRQSVPEVDLDPVLRGSMVGSLELAAHIRIRDGFSLIFALPTGFENVHREPFVPLVGNAKVGGTWGRVHEFQTATKLGVRAVALASALELYLPTALGPSWINCGRPFCFPMENLRRLRPDEPELWTNDTMWSRFRVHGELRSLYLRLVGELTISPGWVIKRDDLPHGFAALFGGLAFVGLRFDWWKPLRGWELTLDCAGSKAIVAPDDRLFPNSPGFEDFIESFAGSGEPQFPNDLDIPIRVGVGLRYHTEKGLFSPGFKVTFDLEDVIPMFVFDLSFRVPSLEERRVILPPRTVVDA